MDGDNAAAMRYTECRLQKITAECWVIWKRKRSTSSRTTTARSREPTVLPTKFPESSGQWRVRHRGGHGTNIPPHNLSEVIDGRWRCSKARRPISKSWIKLVRRRISRRVDHLRSGRGAQLRTGRGRVVMRGQDAFRADRQDRPPGHHRRRSLPGQQVNRCCKRSASWFATRRLSGISDLRDESDKSGMRIVIELKRGEVGHRPQQPLQNTQLQDSFGMNMVALVDQRPRVLNLKDFLEQFILHRREVVTVAPSLRLRRAPRDNIRRSRGRWLTSTDHRADQGVRPDSQTALSPASLTEASWLEVEDVFETGLAGIRRAGWAGKPYRLTDVQAQAIHQMLSLQRLTGLESDKVISDYRE